jgi:hypothetical protein
MDLALYFRVIWRFRALVLIGLVVAVVLAGLSMFRVTSHGLAYRQHETWDSTAVLLVTQQGFPEGRSVFPYKVASDGTVEPSTNFADPTRFTNLAQFYSTVAASDQVVALMHRQAPHVPGAISATPLSTGFGSRATPLPLLSITAEAFTPSGAEATAAAATTAFRTYLSRQQHAAQIPANERVVLQVMNQPTSAVLIAGHKKTIPIVVLFTVLIATLGLAFILENLRPRVRPADVMSLERERTPESVVSSHIA